MRASDPQCPPPIVAMGAPSLNEPHGTLRRQADARAHASRKKASVWRRGVHRERKRKRERCARRQGRGVAHVPQLAHGRLVVLLLLRVELSLGVQRDPLALRVAQRRLRVVAPGRVQLALPLDALARVRHALRRALHRVELLRPLNLLSRLPLVDSRLGAQHLLQLGLLALRLRLQLQQLLHARLRTPKHLQCKPPTLFH
eukprot:2217947-Pleurochrysis_carterae.AAC.1